MSDPVISALWAVAADWATKVVFWPFRKVRRLISRWRLDEKDRETRLRDAYAQLSEAFLFYAHRKSTGMVFPPDTVQRIFKAVGQLKADCPASAAALDRLAGSIQATYSFDVSTANKQYLNPVSDAVQKCLGGKR